jgi:hypothetical protein
MSIEKYLQNLLSSQDLSKKQEGDLQTHKAEVTDFLRAEFGDEPVIKYAGSREKGTMICDRYDLDIVCYFPSSEERSLKEIREDVANRLSQKYLLDHKASAERILDLKGVDAPGDFHIDVVPGRFIENTKDVFLHVAYGEKERMQTNLKTHIDHIVKSECVPIIRLAKLWAHRNNAHLKTFVLELFVVDALSGSQSKNDIKKSFLKVLEAFKDNFASIELVDPANSNNVVSRLVEDSEKSLVAQAAATTYDSIKDSDDVAVWQNAFKDDNNSSSESSGVSATATSAYVAGNSFQPSRPWRGSHDN